MTRKKAFSKGLVTVAGLTPVPMALHASTGVAKLSMLTNPKQTPSWFWKLAGQLTGGGTGSTGFAGSEKRLTIKLVLTACQ